MYKVKIVINGVLREMTINGNNAIEVQQIITNMYSGVGGVQIIDMRRV